MQIESGFRENAEHFTNAFNADYVASDKRVIEEQPQEPPVQDAWGSMGALEPSTQVSVPPKPNMTPQPLQTAPHPPPSVVDVFPSAFDQTSYEYLDKAHREGIDEIQRAIDNVADEIIPGVHPKLLESYSQLLERRTSAVTAYQAFLASSRKTEIEERKIRIAEKKAGMGAKDQGNPTGLSMTPQQLAEFVRAMDDTRMTRIPEAEDADIEPRTGIPDRSFE